MNLTSMTDRSAVLPDVGIPEVPSEMELHSHLVGLVTGVGGLVVSRVGPWTTEPEGLKVTGSSCVVTEEAHLS